MLVLVILREMLYVRQDSSAPMMLTECGVLCICEGSPHILRVKVTRAYCHMAEQKQRFSGCKTCMDYITTVVIAFTVA